MKQLEDKLQAECVKWFRYQYPDLILFAIPNGGSRNPIEAAKFKRTGTLAGVADLFLMKQRSWDVSEHQTMHFSNGLFIEIKVGKNKQTKRQKEFENKCLDEGFDYYICRSFDEFKQVIEDYLN